MGSRYEIFLERSVPLLILKLPFLEGGIRHLIKLFLYIGADGANTGNRIKVPRFNQRCNTALFLAHLLSAHNRLLLVFLPASQTA